MPSPQIIAVLLFAAVVLAGLVYFAQRSARRESERASARAAVDGRRTDYPIVYEWGPNLRTWGPSYRVVIHKDSFTSYIAGVSFAAPISSIWKVAKTDPEGIPHWRVLCHPHSPEPQGLEMFGGGESEVVARVLAHKAEVDVEEPAWFGRRRQPER